MATDRFITKPATPERCRNCRTSLLVGLSEGVKVRVDAIPLDYQASGNKAPHIAEAGAWLLGLRTFVQIYNGELYERDQHRVRHGALSGPIHAEHQCNGGH